MRWLVTACGFLLALSATHALAQSPEAVFAQANASYEEGDYDAAIESYLSLSREGVVDADLFYNLGNAFFKVGRLGYAVLYYERARSLTPRNEDLQRNLALTRSLLHDRQFVVSRGWFKRAVTWAHGNLSTHEAFLVSSLLYLLLCTVVVGFVFRATPLVSRMYETLSMFSPGRFFGLDKTQDFVLAACTVLVLLAATGASAVSKYRTERDRARAVVVEEESPVYSGPSEQATLQYKIHEGTVVRVDDVRPGWVEIQLPGDLSGWVPVGQLERI